MTTIRWANYLRHTKNYTGSGDGNRSPVTAVLPVGLYCFECEVLDVKGAEKGILNPYGEVTLD